MKGVIYTTGEFARKAGVSVRTIRYYDKQGILKPSHMSESGYRLYTDEDFARLQRILSLKYLGFSLEEIQEISMNDTDQDFIRRSLELQLQLVRKKRESLLVVEESLKEASRMIGRTKEVDWKTILHLIHLIAVSYTHLDVYKRQGWQRQEWQSVYSGEEEKEPDPSAVVRCPVCRQECSAKFRYCPNCGQRLR